MSETMVIHPIVAALVKCGDILGKDIVWQPKSRMHEDFLSKYFAKRAELVRYSEKELRSWASSIASELNEILEQEGFSIRLDEFQKNEFGVVSILDVLVEWLSEGERSAIRDKATQGSYPAVSLKRWVMTDKKATATFETLASGKHPNPIAMVHTKSGDKVYMTVSENPLAGFELVGGVDSIRSSLRQGKVGHDNLIFPMVDLDQNVDIGWLPGLWTHARGSKWEIAKALQQTKFKMNEAGARVKSAVALIARSMSMPRDLVIDDPFLLWIERDGLTTPILYAYLDQSSWKDPGGLKM